jgi:hypothetical protein
MLMMVNRRISDLPRAEHRSFMTWHNQHRHVRVAHHVFGSAADPNMPQPGSAVGSRDDQIRVVIFRAQANLFAGVACFQ